MTHWLVSITHSWTVGGTERSRDLSFCALYTSVCCICTTLSQLRYHYRYQQCGHSPEVSAGRFFGFGFTTAEAPQRTFAWEHR